MAEIALFRIVCSERCHEAHFRHLRAAETVAVAYGLVGIFFQVDAPFHAQARRHHHECTQARTCHWPGGFCRQAVPCPFDEGNRNSSVEIRCSEILVLKVWFDPKIVQDEVIVRVCFVGT